jgi:hypothetical protein
MTRLSQTQAPVHSGSSLSVPSMSHSHYVGGHLTARGRRLLAGLALVPLVLGMVLTGTHRAAASGSAPSSVEIVVHPGESLWDIAVAIDPEADPRKTMWEIQQLNHMTTSRLDSGQALLVPTR